MFIWCYILSNENVIIPDEEYDAYLYIHSDFDMKSILAFFFPLIWILEYFFSKSTHLHTLHHQQDI